MKFASIADIHLSRYGQDKIEDSTNLPERLHSIKRALNEVAQYCLTHQIDNLVIKGDLLHGKSIIYAIAQDLMLQFFHDYSDKITFWVIDGNHDLSGKGTDVVSALRALENISNVNWISQTPFHLEKEDMLFVPYSYNLPQTIKENKAKILISHFGLSEGILNSGMSLVSDISLKDFIRRYELVLLGHYHKPQEIIRPELKVYYGGSLIQLDWGEKNDEKRFLVVDTESLEVESIPITEYKKHIEIELNSDNIEEALSAAKAAKENGDHVKINMIESVDLTSIKGEFNIIDKTEIDITNRGITSSMSQADKLQKFIAIKEIPEDQRDAYFNTALKIIEKCEE